MSTKQLNSAEINLPAIAAADLAEEEAIETIAVPNGNDEENAAVSNDTESTISSSSSNAAEDAGQQRTRFVSKRGPRFAVGALAVAVIGVASVHLAGRPTMKNFSSSKQVAVTSSGDIKIKGFTFMGDGVCLDGSAGRGDLYDFVVYDVTSAEACANLCSACPGGGQTGTNNVELVLRGFEFYIDKKLYQYHNEVCECLVDNVAVLPENICKYEGAVVAYDGNGGSGEIKSSSGGDVGPPYGCWRVNSKRSKSSKSGSKGGKRG